MNRRALIETATNVGLGYIVSVFLVYFILPVFGFHPTGGQSIVISVVFTVAALIRGYFVRIWFARFYLRRLPDRRETITEPVEIEICNGTNLPSVHKFKVSVSFHPETGAPVEVFLTDRGKVGQTLDQILYPLGVKASKMMQAGLNPPSEKGDSNVEDDSRDGRGPFDAWFGLGG